MNETMLFLHQHKLLVWTIFAVTLFASLSAIHESFDLTTSSYPWRNLDMYDGALSATNSNNNLLRHRVSELRDENEALKGKLAEDDQDHQLLQRQAAEIERLQKALEAAEAEAKATATANAAAAEKTKSTVPFPEALSYETPLGVSLRLMWSQLVKDTQPGQTNQKILANIKTRDPSPRQNADIVLVTHGSLFKINVFLTQLEYWNGPASIALYMNSLGGDDGMPDGITQLETFMHEHVDRLRNTSIHLIMERNGNGKSLAYPHNPLRNLAMDHSGSDYVVALDVDFIPGPPNCYENLMNALRANNWSMAKEMRLKKRIMVLPAFEVYAPLNETVATPDQLPSSKKELWDSVQGNRSETFRVHRYPAGHRPTNFTTWFDPIVNSKSKYKKPFQPYYPIFYRPGFEPYVLIYRPGVPRYWNAFRGFGQNKLSWFMELHRAGYLFGTLWDFFVVHLEHPTTVNWQERHDNLVLNERFLRYLDEQYPLKDNRPPYSSRYYFTFKNKPIKKPSPPVTKRTGVTTTAAMKAAMMNSTDALGRVSVADSRTNRRGTFVDAEENPPPKSEDERDSEQADSQWRQNIQKERQQKMLQAAGEALGQREKGATNADPNSRSLILERLKRIREARAQTGDEDFVDATESDGDEDSTIVAETLTPNEGDGEEQEDEFEAEDDIASNNSPEISKDGTLSDGKEGDEAQRKKEQMMHQADEAPTRPKEGTKSDEAPPTETSEQDKGVILEKASDR